MTCSSRIPITSRPLLRDTSRCTDSACPERLECQRFMDRTGGDWVPHQATLREPELFG